MQGLKKKKIACFRDARCTFKTWRSVLNTTSLTHTLTEEVNTIHPSWELQQWANVMAITSWSLAAVSNEFSNSQSLGRASMSIRVQWDCTRVFISRAAAFSSLWKVHATCCSAMTVRNNSRGQRYVQFYSQITQQYKAYLFQKPLEGELHIVRHRTQTFAFSSHLPNELLLMACRSVCDCHACRLIFL